MQYRLKVFITVDTEPSLHSQVADTEEAYQKLFERDIMGLTTHGDYGLDYQIRTLNRYGVKAVFFVEPLFALAMGEERLRSIIEMVQRGGHDVQLHLHTEWLERRDFPALPGRRGEDIADFTLGEQILLLQHAKSLLERNGAANVCAFRAGNYGASCETLKALAAIGIRYDTSYNRCYAGSRCTISSHKPLIQPKRLEGVVEFPISYVEDYPGHYRHAELNAVCWPEMRSALIAARQRRWHSFVIVSHSFELLRGRDKSLRNRYNAAPDRVMLRRFERLCEFLSENPDKYESATFSELDAASVPELSAESVPVTGVLYMGWRMMEQFARRF